MTFDAGLQKRSRRARRPEGKDQVTGYRSRRLATVVSAALVAVMLLGVGAASAAPPKWDITFVKLPPVVTVGEDAGYRVTVWNNGASNIVGLSISSVPTNPTYVSSLAYSTGGTGSCSIAAPFTCNIGTLTAFSSVTFTIAYTTSGSSPFSVDFTIRSSSGDTNADNKPGKPGTSHGDALTKAVSTALALASSNAAGGFFQADELLQTNPILGRQNKQSTSLIGFVGASGTDPYDVMISDGTTTFPTDPEDPNTGLSCVGSSCTGLLGQWSFVNLKEGATQGTAFHVQMILDGSLIPGGTSAADLVLVHVYYDSDHNSQTEVIGENGVRCATATTPSAYPTSCIFITRVGPLWQVDAWLYHNGGLRLQ
jgi:hypothetical protein